MNQETVKVEYHNGVALVMLNRGITNALNLELINQLSNILKKLKQDNGVIGVVISSSNEKFFSIGFDIPQLFGLPRSDFKIFYGSFNHLCLNLYTFPKPTIAAITGHAVAGGCIIALCCDYRFIAEGKKKMGLNEIKLGVPIPYPADLILQQIAGYRHAREIVDTGEFFMPEILEKMGLVDTIMPLDQIQAKAIEKVQQLAMSSQKTYAEIKRSRVEITEARTLSKLEEKEKIFLDLWYSDEARKRLKEAMGKFQIQLTLKPVGIEGV
jgi:enoyl-CoA hydratase/carnithine racemase